MLYRVSMKKQQSSVSFDAIFDSALGSIGIPAKAVEKFLSANKKKSRIAANTLSLTRIALGYIAIRNYEHAKEKKDTKGMVTNMGLLGLIMATDAVDGYLSRKAHISGSKSGKIIDSVSDVALRLAIAQSSLSEKDNLAIIRGIGEIAVGTAALPDIVEGKYTSTNLGKIKVNADAVAVITSLLKDVVPKKTASEKSLQVLHDAARSAAAALAILDGVKRLTSKKKTTAHIKSKK